MPKIDVSKVLGVVDGKIGDIVSQYVKRKKNAYVEAANKLKEAMQGDLERYTSLLENSKISKEDFDHLVRGRAAQLKIEVLSEASISKSKFDFISDDMLALLIKTTITLLIAV